MISKCYFFIPIDNNIVIKCNYIDKFQLSKDVEVFDIIPSYKNKKVRITKVFSLNSRKSESKFFEFNYEEFNEDIYHFSKIINDNIVMFDMELKKDKIFDLEYIKKIYNLEFLFYKTFQGAIIGTNNTFCNNTIISKNGSLERIKIYNDKKYNSWDYFDYKCNTGIFNSNDSKKYPTEIKVNLYDEDFYYIIELSPTCRIYADLNTYSKVNSDTIEISVGNEKGVNDKYKEKIIINRFFFEKLSQSNFEHLHYLYIDKDSKTIMIEEKERNYNKLTFPFHYVDSMKIIDLIEPYTYELLYYNGLKELKKKMINYKSIIEYFELNIKELFK